MDLSRIEERVRDNTGWSNESDLSPERLLEAINYAYTHKIPEKIDWQGLQDWVFIDLVNETSRYDFDTTLLDASGGNVVGTRIRNLLPPAIILIDDDQAPPLHFTYDRDGFWKAFPPYTNETTSTPTHVLIDGRALWPRPIPDDEYTYIVKVWANWRPEELSDPGDEAIAGWEEATIAGATALLNEDDEEDETSGWWDLYRDRCAEIMSANKRRPGRVRPRW